MATRVAEVACEPAVLLRTLQDRIARESRREADAGRRARLSSFGRRVFARLSELGAR